MTRPTRIGIWATLAMVALAGCSREARDLGPTQPQTPPNGAVDPRQARYRANASQVSQGGLYFTWYGCGSCHGDNAKGALDLRNAPAATGRTIDRIYAAIAHGHPGNLPHYGEQIPTEQIWQIAAFILDMPQEKPEVLRRQNLEMASEPQGSSWSGPVP